MRTIGLMGGMSWESTVEYYKIINGAVNERLGGLHSAKILLYSFDFEQIEQLMREERWSDVGTRVAVVARTLEKAGADLLVLCTNTIHKVADYIEGYVDIPFLHIADAVGESIRKARLKGVGLLGTKYTMEENFYKDRLKLKHGIDVIVPPEEDRNIVNDVIFQELCLGIRKESSKDRFHKIIENLISAGAQGIVLGCTEIHMLVTQQDFHVPLFDTTRIHALQAVEWALKE